MSACEPKTSFEIRPTTDDDRGWTARLLEEHWGSVEIVTRGTMYRADRLPGFIAESGGNRLGLITYRIDGRQCEVVSLNSLTESVGIGTALLEAVKGAARDVECTRLWLITTNDNLAAIRFYQRRGLSLVAVHRNAIDRSRALKPTIPLTGIDGIPIRDEIELEVLL